MTRTDSPAASSKQTGSHRRDHVAAQLELIGSVRRIMHAFDVRSRRLRATDRFTLPQLLCLMAVVAEEGLTSRQIARRLHVSASTLVGVLDRLQASRWIDRIRDSDDRRRVHIVPTDAGRQVILTAPSLFGEHFDRSYADLSASARNRLAKQVALMATLMAPQDDLLT